MFLSAINVIDPIYVAENPDDPHGKQLSREK